MRTAIHKKNAAAEARKRGFDVRLSRSRLSLIVYRVINGYGLANVVAVLPLEGHCVERSDLRKAIGAA